MSVKRTRPSQASSQSAEHKDAYDKEKRLGKKQVRKRMHMAECIWPNAHNRVHITECSSSNAHDRTAQKQKAPMRGLEYAQLVWIGAPDRNRTCIKSFGNSHSIH